jgi:hypothetical protein
LSHASFISGSSSMALSYALQPSRMSPMDTRARPR